MLNKQQYQKLQSMGLSARQIQQVLNATGGVDQGKSLGGFIGNTINSGDRLVGDLASGLVNVFNPNIEQNTIANMADLVGDAGVLAGNTLRGLTGKRKLTDEEMANLPSIIGGANRAQALGQFYKDRYGSGKNILNTLYNDPIGVLGDLSTVVGGTGALVKGAGNLARAGKVASVGSKIANFGRALDPLSVVGRGARVATRPIANAVKNSDLPAMLTRQADQLSTRGIGNPAQQSKLRRPLAEYIREYDLWSRDPEVASAAQRAVGAQYGDLVRGSDQVTQARAIIGALDDEMAKIQGGFMGDFDTERLNSLNQQKMNIIANLGKGGVSGSQLLDYRQMLDRDITQSAFDPARKVSGQQSALKSTRDIFKTNIDALSPEIAKLGTDYGDLGQIRKILENSQNRAVNRQAVNFTRLGSAGLGSVVAGLPGAIAGFAAEQFVNSPRGIRTASQALRNTASTLAGARQSARTLPSLPQLSKLQSTSKAILPQLYNVARTSRVANPPAMSREDKSSNIKFTPISVDFATPKSAFEMPKRQQINVPRY